MFDLREISEFLRDFGKYIIIILIMILIFTFIVVFQPVAGNSMTPTLKEGDVLLVSKLSKNYQRNEIVSLRVNDKNFVKRIIGLPGEEVHYLKGVLYIDGVGYKEDFLSEKVVTNNFMFVDICNETDCPEGKIPEGKYLVLGDNRPESEDSRTPKFGLVSEDQIIGKAIFRIWPIGSFGGVN